MKIAILGVENSHADAFGKLVKENELREKPHHTPVALLSIHFLSLF